MGYTHAHTHAHPHSRNTQARGTMFNTRWTDGPYLLIKKGREKKENSKTNKLRDAQTDKETYDDGSSQ